MPQPTAQPPGTLPRLQTPGVVPKVITPVNSKVSTPVSTPFSTSKLPTYPASDLYLALAKQETGAYPDPYIRTHVTPKGGSTAYGPVQMTGPLVKDYLERYPSLFTESERVFMREFEKQANLFRRYGGQTGRLEPGYHSNYDYGGSGNLTNNADKKAYENVAKKILTQMLDGGKSVAAVATRWRGTNDPDYIKGVKNSLLQNSTSANRNATNK